MALVWFIGSIISSLIVIIIGGSLKHKGKINDKDFWILLTLAFVFGWLFLIVYLFRTKRYKNEIL